jgi:hypothetical protein
MSLHLYSLRQYISSLYTSIESIVLLGWRFCVIFPVSWHAVEDSCVD